jgi:hypothetical protein
VASKGLPEKFFSMFLEPGSYENFLLFPSHPQHSEILLNTISLYLNTKIEIYFEGRGCLMRTIYTQPRRKKEKLRILRDNNLYYPLWKTDYFNNYDLC